MKTTLREEILSYLSNELATSNELSKALGRDRSKSEGYWRTCSGKAKFTWISRRRAKLNTNITSSMRNSPLKELSGQRTLFE